MHDCASEVELDGGQTHPPRCHPPRCQGCSQEATVWAGVRPVLHVEGHCPRSNVHAECEHQLKESGPHLAMPTLLLVSSWFSRDRAVHRQQFHVVRPTAVSSK